MKFRQSDQLGSRESIGMGYKFLGSASLEQLDDIAEGADRFRFLVSLMLHHAEVKVGLDKIPIQIDGASQSCFGLRTMADLIQ